MDDGVQFTLDGVEELTATLRGVTEDTRRRGGRFALRKAAQVIRDQAKSNAERLDDPDSPQNISLNIVERWSGRYYRRTGDLMFRVGVLGGARQYATTRENVRRGRAGQFYSTGGDTGNPGGDTFYWRFLEFGTERAAAKPFMRPAIDQAGQQAVNTFISEYQKSLDRAIRRAMRQGARA